MEDVTGLLSLLQPPKHGGRGGRDMHPRSWDPADGVQVEGMVKLLCAGSGNKGKEGA